MGRDSTSPTQAVRPQTTLREQALFRGDTPNREGGFTLIELLIVIFIIAVLAALAAVAVGKAKEKMMRTEATQTITAFGTGLNQYYLDYNLYPGYGDEDFDYGKNQFPMLYEALLGEKPPDGRAGKGAPYVDKVNNKEIVIYDDSEDEEYPWIVANRDDLLDPDMEKYYLDPWGSPYHYRECKSKRSREPWMINRSKFDLWSYGPNETDESIEGMPDPDDFEEDEVDDIGNWSW